jgi:hypothetical protein
MTGDPDEASRNVKIAQKVSVDDDLIDPERESEFGETRREPVFIIDEN